MTADDRSSIRTAQARLPLLRVLAASLALSLATAASAFAEDQAQPGVPATAGGPSLGPEQKSAGASQPAWAGDLSTRANLLGDIGGLRPALDRYGVSFGLTETTEVLGNPTGGTRRGAIIEGMTQMSLGADLSKSIGLDGAIFNISAFQIHGRGLSSRNLGNLNIVSSIEADPATRLNELWLQQSFWGGKLDIKIGQQSADLEFITSEYEDLFINSGFGWPTLPASDLPSGGPAYPLATPGIRVRAQPTDEITALVGLYSGSPAGLRPGDPQKNDSSGTNFDVSSGAFVIGEVQYGLNKQKDATGLPGTYKLGAWYNSNRFADAFYQNGTTAQAPGVLTGLPGSKRGDWSIYGTLDQLVYRPSKDSDGGLGLTARAMGAPDDRNVVDLFVQGGVTYKGAFGRANDTMGIGVEWARIGARAQAGDGAAALASGTASPIRSSETVIEATYQAQIEPWWIVQPDFQYVFNPGGGLPDPDHPNRRVGDAAVLGIRSVVTF
ncbi:carbohydrate porin [Lichenihabitans psoromatis]|uniref:carbohydrate porin n=1 Tax=Lichenihabitans psoromatis TaxID=2528642 RepID=UPI001038309D|nr:carbohydrate porin [Lichenihabitans psoromatis]